MSQGIGRAPATRALAAVAALAALALSMTFSAPARADSLEDRKAAIESEKQQVLQDYEYLGEDIAETVAKLNIYNGQLPGAQQQLADAEGRVDTAAGKVSALNERVALAQDTHSTITAQIEKDREDIAASEKAIGQIASQAYKNGGVPSTLSLIFGAKGADSLSDSLGMAEQALKGQNAAVEKLSQQNANNVNSEARLAAVAEEISKLKAQADEALKAEQSARDAAAAEKAKVDDLIAQTAAINKELEAQKPKLQAQISSLEKETAQINADIAEQQRIQLEQYRQREQARIDAANRAAAEEAARNNRPAPPVQNIPAQGSPSSFGLQFPVRNAPVSSGYGHRPTPPGTLELGSMHTGIDFAPGCGSPVYAAAAGEVWRAVPQNDQREMIGAGNYVVLNHGVVSGNVLATNYYHLQQYVVGQGQWVNQGQLIGYVGNTGNSSGCHLHFETVLNGNLVNPMSLL
ncbi:MULTISPECIES: peptidoglycan DD-metalloendopeptidase family protein [unclassified Arthrobacter]|uniref:peptidoglycan DD-metalloendopeptidase family protein n=1 Tax=unclassified Arthrobacter TaxID=235627 RepID=UPI0024E00FDF|nr:MULTISPECIES: peptidoglycan DD-metalloendopeptidase family protein [unclassified Arthrobacter]MCC9146486.1 peptidoglycan DD-metalloendopeptidase family protein [Arthrobacter sp. zg-Y919]MDK1277716.1 peptidoglycan DD-metalloendopeptidase family protein [Arthrobacter sp. zg.Y919]WIB02328.1 peptidoglycan DD-metalloendopeptidase family protein [Arthrobacter sp. zg-Y919]